VNIVGTARRVRIYLDQTDRWHHRPLFLAIIERLRAEGCAGATAVHGVAGFGLHSRIATAGILDLSADLPVVVEWVDTPDRVDRVLPAILAMVREGLVTVEDVDVVKYSHRPLHGPPADLTVGEVMTSPAAFAHPDTPLRELVQFLLEREGRALPIVDSEQRPVGIVTNTDLVERGGLLLRLELLGALTADQLAEILASFDAGRTVAEVMTSEVVTVHPETPLSEAGRIMAARNLKRLPVVDGAGRLVGVVSRVDLLRSVAEGYPYPETQEPSVRRPPQTIGDLMTTGVPMVHGDTPLGEVVDLLVATPLNRAVVVDEQGHVIGLISDAEVVRHLPTVRAGDTLHTALRRLTGQQSEPSAAEVMIREVVTVEVDTPLVEATRMMLASRHKLLPVVDRGRRLVGMVDRADLLRAFFPSGTGDGERHVAEQC